MVIVSATVVIVAIIEIIVGITLCMKILKKNGGNGIALCMKMLRKNGGNGGLGSDLENERN